MLCPVFNCRDERTLKRFNDFGYMYDHLIKHKVKNDVAATKLVERYTFVENWFKDNKFSSLEDSLAAIEAASEDGKSFSLGDINLFCPSARDTFKGQQHLMEESAVRKYILGDVNAFRNVNAPITSYFAKPSRGSKEVGTSTQKTKSGSAHSNKENVQSSSSSNTGASSSKASSTPPTQEKRKDGDNSSLKKKAKKKNIEVALNDPDNTRIIHKKRDRIADKIADRVSDKTTKKKSVVAVNSSDKTGTASKKKIRKMLP